jgi:low affinity Fe/Cu permease
MATRPARTEGAARDHRGPFERFVESAQRAISRPGFFVLTVLIVIGWAASLPLWTDMKSWAAAIDAMASVIALLLLALLENASRRSGEAEQEKLNTIAEALGALMDSRAAEDPEMTDHAQRLREAVGLEERH